MQSSYEERLAAYLGKQIREDTTAVYGASSSGVSTVPAAALSLALATAPQPARLMLYSCIAGR